MSSHLLVFGKTPQMGDFVRVGSPGPAGEALERWVEQGLASAEAKWGAAWPRAYTAGPMHAFVFRAPHAASSRDAVAGVIQPSVDAVGRRFPLVVYAQALPRPEFAWPHVLPLAFGDFFDAARAVLGETRAVASAADMMAAAMRVPAPLLERVEWKAREYEAWTEQALLSQAWDAIYGPAGAAMAAHALHVIAEAVAPFRGEVAPVTKLGLRLPLGAGGCAAAVFWLDVLRRLARSLAEVRTCFWCFDGTIGSLIVQLGDTPGTTLAELWAPDSDSEHLCDLTQPASIDVGRFSSGLPGPLIGALQSPAIVVRDFLERLSA